MQTRNFSFFEQVQIVFSDFRPSIFVHKYFLLFCLILVASNVLIHTTSRTTNSTKVISTQEQNPKTKQIYTWVSVYYEVDRIEYVTGFVGDSTNTQMLVHYFPTSPSFSPTIDMEGSQFKFLGFDVYESLFNSWIILFMITAFIAMLPLFLIVLTTFATFVITLLSSSKKLKIAQEGELTIGIYEEKQPTETDIKATIQAIPFLSEAQKQEMIEKAQSKPQTPQFVHAKKLFSLCFIDKQENEQVFIVQNIPSKSKDGVISILYLPESPRNYLIVENLSQSVQDKLDFEIKKLKKDFFTKLSRNDNT